MALSPSAWADEPTQPPEDYHPDRYPQASARWNVVLGGTALFAGSYGMAYGTSYLWPDAPTASDLRLPVVGPFMAMAGARCGSSESGCGAFSVVLRTVFATLSGIGQVGGVGLIIEGIFMPTSTGKESSSSLLTQTSALRTPDSTRARAAQPQWMLAPTMDESSLGLSVSGSF